MKKVIFLGLCCALLAAAGKSEAPGGGWDARLYGYTGSVLVRPAGGKNWTNARRGLPLSQGDVVRTGKKSSADISLDGRGIVTLNASTEFDLKTLKRKDSSFLLRAGRLIVKITGLKARAERLTVRTPTAVAAVRGTEFGVDYEKDLAETLVNVFEEGQVEVTSLDENGNPVGETITVIPRHEVRVKKEMEAMSLAQSPASRYKDPGIAAVRGKLGALEKSYQPLDRQQREEERAQTFERKGQGRTAAGYDEERADREGAGAYDKAGRKKGGAAGDGYADGGAGRDGGKRGEAGYARGARDTGEEGGPGGRYAKGRKGESEDDDGRAAGAHRYKKGFDGEDGGPHRFKKGRGDDDDGPGRGGLAGKGRGGKGGKSGDDDDGHLRTKAGGAGNGAAGGKIKANIAGDLKAGAGTGATSAIGARAGAASGPILSAAADGALSRPTSATDKGVGTIVSRVQERLAATGNDGVISNSELRTMVISAAKTSPTDASFLSALNASIAERITLAETSSIQANTALGAAKPTLATQTLGTNTSVIGVTNPNITSPVMTNTSINSGSVNTGTVKKKTVVAP